MLWSAKCRFPFCSDLAVKSRLSGMFPYVNGPRAVACEASISIKPCPRKYPSRVKSGGQSVYGVKSYTGIVAVHKVHHRNLFFSSGVQVSCQLMQRSEWPFCNETTLTLTLLIHDVISTQFWRRGNYIFIRGFILRTIRYLCVWQFWCTNVGFWISFIMSVVLYIYWCIR